MPRNVDLISDLDTDLAVAFLVEKRFEGMASNEAVALIDRVKCLLERVSESSRGREAENIQSFAAR